MWCYRPHIPFANFIHIIIILVLDVCNIFRPAKTYVDMPCFLVRYMTSYQASVNWVIIGRGYGLLPFRSQVITSASANCQLDFNNAFQRYFIWQSKHFIQEMHLKKSSAKCRPLGLGLNVLKPNGMVRSINQRWFPNDETRNMNRVLS